LALGGRPLVGLLLYVFTFYFYAPGSWWGNDLPDLRWSLLSALVTLVAIYVRENKSRNNDPLLSVYPQKPDFFSLTENKLFLSFVIWVWIQTLWASSPAYHSEYAFMATKFLLLLFLMHKALVDEKSVIAFVVVNLLGCGYFGWISFSEHQGGRFESVPTPGLNDGNLLGLHMMPILLLGSFLLLCDFSKRKFLLAFPIVLTLFAILQTQSRGAMVGLIIGALLAFLFRPHKLRAQIYLYILLASVAAIRLVPPDLIDRLSQAAGPEELRDESADSRIVIVKAQYEMFKQAPIQGYGHRGTLILSPYYIDDTYLTGKSDSRYRGSHNLLMSLLVDFGLIGASFYLGIIFVFIKRLFSIRRSILQLANGNLSILYMAGSSALVALMVSSMFSNSLRLEIDILLIGLLSATYCLIRANHQFLDSANHSGGEQNNHLELRSQDG